MTDIILTVVCVGIASSLISYFFDDDSETLKYVRLVLSLCFLCSIIPGGVKLLSNFNFDIQSDAETNIFDFNEIRESYYSDFRYQAETELEKQLSQIIFENVGIIVKGMDIQLSVSVEENVTEYTIERIIANVSADNDGEIIAKFIQNNLGIKSEIVIETGESNEENQGFAQ